MAKKKNELFDGKICYFIDEWRGLKEPICMGTCNADDHWEALDKFERGLGVSYPMERGKQYRIRKSGQPADGFACLIKFVY